MRYVYIALLFALSFTANADVKSNAKKVVSNTKSSNIIVPQSNIMQILEDYFNNLKSFSASFVQQSRNVNNNIIEKCEGTINICRDQKNPKMQIKYKDGKIKEIYMEGRYISIVNSQTNKKKTYSILTTPLYALLSGSIDIQKLKPVIIVNKYDITVNIKSDKQNITLVFSTITKNNKLNINKLLAWTVDDGKTIINVGFDDKNYLVNDKAIIEHDNNKNVPN
ncbi:MAG: outer-membrane lipoprotein carrier protein LolA [Alphaproteobacteria bacterium]|nr:outer-membrane lipoprotein carrier protein LolA [Alphaproteobacteria bacterium]